MALLSTYDRVGGAARATYRLHQGLRGAGIDSVLVVQTKRTQDPTVRRMGGLLGGVEGRLRRVLHSLPVRWRRGGFEGTFTPAALPDSVAPRVAALHPDLVHLTWVADGFLRLETIARFGKPLVWTLHDSWAFTGGCHVPFECVRYRDSCGHCPALGSTADRDLSRAIWERKARAWRGLAVTFVAPSRWLAEAARSSALGRGLPVEMIRNGLDLDRFRPANPREARAALGLPFDKRLILFVGVAGLRDPNKGFHLLAAALRALGAEGLGARVELVVLGASAPAGASDLGVPTRYAGVVADEERLALYYAASDVLVVPSIQENQPNTASEALACGVPCVAFRASGMPDLIEHERTGYLARPFETDDFARGIAWVLGDDARRARLGAEARRWAVEELGLERCVHDYRTLYEGILRGATV